jgi:DNA repair exonuclease SbcCD ATPase subunit
LREFAAEAELDLPELNVPEELPGLAEFEKSTKKAVSQLRSQVPGIEEQKKLITRQQQLLTAKTAWESLRQRWTDLGAQTRTLDKEHAGRKAVEAKIADASEKLEAQQDQLRQTNGRAAVVHEAVGFLESLADPEPPCPVCESVVPNLAEKLKDLWASNLKNLVEHITAKINSLKAQLKDLRGTASQYQRLNDQAELLKEEQASLHAKTADLLAVEIQDDDDPLAMIVAEQNQLATRLQQLGQAIQGRQDRLDAIERDLDLVRLARDYLHHEQKKQVLETIQESDAFKNLEVIRDQIAQLVEDAEAIKNAVAEVAREEAETKLTAAGETIDEYFQQLSRNPAVRQLKLTITADKRTRRNSYDITDQDCNDLTPILSQGDMNALALAIFLGLAATAKESSRFRFLMLDDPSQSLGTEHKKQLAKLLDHVAQHRTLVLATMDAEFHDCMKVSFTKAQKEYRFGTWTPDDGPSITTMDTDDGNPVRSGRPAKPRPERIRS